MKGKWIYDEQWDTWRFWRDEDEQNVVKICRSKHFGLIPARLRGSDITNEQLGEIVLPVQDTLFNLSDTGIYFYEVLD